MARKRESLTGDQKPLTSLAETTEAVPGARTTGIISTREGHQPYTQRGKLWEYQVQRESNKVTRWIAEDVLLLNSTKI